MNHPKMNYTYAGIDSHKNQHTAVFINCFFEKLGEITFDNLPTKFDDFLDKAESLKLEGTTLVFALEDVSAYGRMLAVFLNKKNQMVKHVNAIMVAMERKNQNFVEKTDSVDAECCARVLLSKFDKLPKADTQDKYWILKTLVKSREHIMKHKTGLKNYLHSLIMTHYPNYHNYFFHIDCNTSLAFLERYPSPLAFKDTTFDELNDFIYEASKGTVSEKKAGEIFDHIKNNGDTIVEFQEMRDMIVQSIVRQIRFNMQEIERIESKLEEFLLIFECPLTSMRGIDVVTAASMLACIGDIDRFPTSAKLAKYAGVSPVSYSSGKKDLRFANERGNRRLSTLFHELAIHCIRVSSSNKIMNPYFYEYYQKKLSEGKTKHQALKSVQRRLVNIVWTMMKKKEEYINPPIYDALLEKAK